MLIEEGSLKQKDDLLYTSTPVQSMFADAQEIVCSENEFLAQLYLPGTLYPISSEGRSRVKGRKVTEVVAVLCAFDKWFGYDSCC